MKKKCGGVTTVILYINYHRNTKELGETLSLFYELWESIEIWILTKSNLFNRKEANNKATWNFQSIYFPMIFSYVWFRAFYLNIMVSSLRAKCHILRDTLCNKRRPFYDRNVTPLSKSAVSIDRAFFGLFDEGSLLESLQSFLHSSQSHL